MKVYTVTQKILSIGSTYIVKAEGSDDILNTVKGKILTMTPKLEMLKGKDGEVVKVLKGNFFRTKFNVENTDGSVNASIAFPFVALFKKFTLTVGTKVYNGKGSLTAWNFTCTDEGGLSAFTITKEFSFKDKFTVSVDEAMPADIAMLVAIAVDQKFFTQK